MDLPAVIFDNGSGLCKAGVAGDLFPKTVFTSVVGRSQVTPPMVGVGQKECYIGEEAQARRGVLSLTYPVERGMITSWDDIEKIWTHVYDRELHLTASDHPVLLTEVPLSPLQNREKAAEIMFELFNVPGMYVALQAALTLYASGATTGMFVNIGDGVVHAVPIFDGYIISHAMARLHLAGSDITECLMRLLFEIGHTFMSSAEREIARDIKERLCYVELEPQETRTEALKVYTLPDGNTVSLGSQLSRAPEILFSPANVGLEAPGVHELLYRSIMKCPIDVRRDLYGSIVLTGGTTLFPGFEERISREVEHLVPSGVKVRTILPEKRQYSVWMGASILSSLSVFRDLWLTSSEYKEVGPAAVHKRCL
ncbi:hypothetical protein GDO81_026450 [Engystomops pustulosus]|uniref:Actin n=1 Tax=Engystomops pustulosus TaxID=76066 RepID=A0AAV6Z0C4_ENGPU|nr:hypothetical protein GDO81_026451 [Engystomops pustulosus]KAG8542596.1 hypothetical protein GDO81_026450 [Engystomops pustulosus]